MIFVFYLQTVRGKYYMLIAVNQIGTQASVINWDGRGKDGRQLYTASFGIRAKLPSERRIPVYKRVFGIDQQLLKWFFALLKTIFIVMVYNLQKKRSENMLNKNDKSGFLDFSEIFHWFLVQTQKFFSLFKKNSILRSYVKVTYWIFFKTTLYLLF